MASLGVSSGPISTTLVTTTLGLVGGHEHSDRRNAGIQCERSVLGELYPASFVGYAVRLPATLLQRPPSRLWR